jgi:hypothetical protein
LMTTRDGKRITGISVWDRMIVWILGDIGAFK